MSKGAIEDALVRGDFMHIYVRCGRIFAVYWECSKALGSTPLFALDSCEGETVLNMPWTQIILTPRKRLLEEKAIRHERDHDDETRPVPENFAGTPED